MDEKPPAYQPQGAPQPGYPPAPGGYPPQQGGYPPQQGAYPPPQQAYQPPPGATVVVQGMNPTMMSTTPVQMTCPACGAQVVTRVVYENGTLVWLLFVLLLIFFICVSCVPFCIDDCKDAVHYCPNCNTCLGTKRRM